MKKNILIFFLVFSICTVSFGQNQTIDSLKQVLIHLKNNTNKVIVLNELGKRLINVGLYDISIKYAEEGLKIADKLNYKKGQIRANTNIGLVCYYKGDFRFNTLCKAHTNRINYQ